MQGEFRPRGLQRRQEGVARGEHHARGDSTGRGRPVAERSLERLSPRQGQGPGPESQHHGGGDDHGREQDGVAPRQAGRRQGGRSDQQKSEGIGDAAREEQHCRQLKHVEAELGRRFGVGGEPAAPTGQPDPEVHRGADTDQARPQHRARVEAEQQADGKKGEDLAGYADPPHQDDGFQPKPAQLQRRPLGPLAQHLRIEGRGDHR